MSRRRLLFALTATLLALAAAAGLAVAGDGKKNDKSFEYAIGLWGDMPIRTRRRKQACRT